MAAPAGNQFWKLRSTHGRDLIFSSPQILWQACIEFFEAWDQRVWVKKDWVGKDAIPVDRETRAPYTLTGMFTFLDIDRKTWDLYRNREEFIPIISRVEQIIFTQKIEGAAVGAYNANIVARELGLKDNQDVTTGGEKINTTPNINLQIDGEDIKLK